MFDRDSDSQWKHYRSHSVFDASSVSLKKLKEMKTTWDDEESNQRKTLTKMLDNLKNIIKEHEEEESRKNITRRLSALDKSEMSQLLCDSIGFQCKEENVRILEKKTFLQKETNDKIQPLINNISWKKAIFISFISF